MAILYYKNEKYIFTIEQDSPEIGYYLYVYESGKCIKDHLQDSVEVLKEIALDFYSVPIEGWTEYNITMSDIKIDNGLTNFFIPDGSLRDIYVSNTTKEDWKLLYDLLLSSSSFTLEYYIDMERQNQSSNIYDMLADDQQTHFIKLFYKGETFTCIPYTTEIEFVIDPKSKPDIPIVIDFMKVLKNQLSKDVNLNYEGERGEPFLRVQLQSPE